MSNVTQCDCGESEVCLNSHEGYWCWGKDTPSRTALCFEKHPSYRSTHAYCPGCGDLLYFDWRGGPVAKAMVTLDYLHDELDMQGAYIAALEDDSSKMYEALMYLAELFLSKIPWRVPIPPRLASGLCDESATLDDPILPTRAMEPYELVGQALTAADVTLRMVKE